MAGKPSIGLSNAGIDLGLGGALQQQVGDQAEELRKKKMREQQGMSPAVQSLFGGGMGGIGSGGY